MLNGVANLQKGVKRLVGEWDSFTERTNGSGRQFVEANSKSLSVSIVGYNRLEVSRIQGTVTTPWRQSEATNHKACQISCCGRTACQTLLHHVFLCASYML
jgi:hypothetical protein